MNLDTTLDLKAEAYFLANFPALQGGFEGFFLDCLGTRQRGRSRDVLGLEVQHSVLDHKVIELLGLQVSRNGMFHLLPEALFQPLSLGTAGANTYEIVDEMRSNREREQGNRRFFSPFDSEFFYYATHLLQRQLGWPMRRSKTARALVAEIADRDFGYDEEKSQLLLAFFANAERAKDNAPLLMQLLSRLLDREVRITACHLAPPILPFVALGHCTLAVDTVLSGFPVQEADDWLVEISYDDPSELAAATAGDQAQHAVLAILDYFVLAGREISVRLVALPQARSEQMGQGILGINIYLNHAVA